MFYNCNESFFIDEENSYFQASNYLDNSFPQIDNLNTDKDFISSFVDEKDKDKDNYSIKDNEQNFNIDIKHEVTINQDIDEKSTNYKIEINQLFQKDKSILNNDINNNVEDSYKLYSFDQIKQILEKNENLADIITKLNKSKYIENEEKKRLSNKKIKIEGFEKDEEADENKITCEGKNNSKRGRKCKANNNREEHKKTSSDNIIKKIKSKILNYLVEFMNNMIDKSKNDKIKFYKLNYKYINQINRNVDLQLLKMKVEELLSKEISPKFKNLNNSNYNKTLISNIKNNIKGDDKDYNTLIFVLNLTFEEWFSLFIFKKNINEIIAEKGINSNEINIEKIQNNLNGFEQLLRKMAKENELYFSNFIFLLFNYGHWFFIKKGRSSKKVKNE